MGRLLFVLGQHKQALGGVSGCDCNGDNSIYTHMLVRTNNAGNLADGFIQRGTPRLTVRRGAHTISTLGCAACAIPLAAGLATTPAAATLWLVLFQSCYAFSFGGFHAYVQVCYV